MIKTVVFDFNSAKESVWDTLKGCLSVCNQHGVQVLFQEKDRTFLTEAGLNKLSGFKWTETVSRETADAIFVFGGDGTVLQALTQFSENDLPILGINLGRLGFLLETEVIEMDSALEQLCAGNYQIEKRLMLEIAYRGLPGGRCVAMNEVTISRGSCPRLIALDACIGNTLVDHYIADGVVLASPTGSTGYSLSAGGPIVSPDVSCFVLSPICPHSLQSRPIVLSSDEAVTLRINMKEEREGMILSIDGQQVCVVSNLDRVTVTRAAHDAQLIRFPKERNFYHMLREKLSQWSL